jgi:hypothetical protein
MASKLAILLARGTSGSNLAAGSTTESGSSLPLSADVYHVGDDQDPFGIIDRCNAEPMRWIASREPWFTRWSFSVPAPARRGSLR